MTPDVLGLDQEDRQQVAHWPGGVTEFVTGPVLTPERRRHCLDCAEQLEAHLAPVVERRRHPGDDLVSMLRTAVDDLARDPRRARAREALTAGYFSGAPTQEAAARRLGLPYGTYRRHLRHGPDLLCEAPWQQELHGPAAEPS
ncbi:hypothetical protein [Kitasatospora sp. NPDC007106]|uniref:hypothetical protein n=1 Tax=Kitasatospora sp. NPDC007106 TaxID=3156914 RepID=UPI0033FCF7A0